MPYGTTRPQWVNKPYHQSLKTTAFPWVTSWWKWMANLHVWWREHQTVGAADSMGIMSWSHTPCYRVLLLVMTHEHYDDDDDDDFICHWVVGSQGSRAHLVGLCMCVMTAQISSNSPDSKVRGANMGPIWGRQDPGGPHVGPMNFAIWVNFLFNILTRIRTMKTPSLALCDGNDTCINKLIIWTNVDLLSIAPLGSNSVIRCNKSSKIILQYSYTADHSWLTQGF